MSESNINAIITAIGSLLGGIIGAYATIQAAKAKLPANPNNTEVKSPLLGIIAGAVIGAVVTLAVLLFLGFIPAQPKENVFTQNFDGSDGSFDASIFVCPAISCNAQNVFQRNGVLVFKFNASELSSDIWGAYMKSQVTWKMDNLISIEGNLQISANTKGGTWLGLNESSACVLSVEPNDDTPSIHCDLTSNETKEYSTTYLPAEFGTWYLVRIDYDSLTGEQKFYLDNVLIGRYTPKDLPDVASLSLGSWRAENQSVNAFIDNIVVRYRP